MNTSTAVQQTDESSMDIGFYHGDLHGFNAHLNDDLLTHYDFGEYGFEYRIYDLATFKWSFFFSDSGADRWSAFLDGHQLLEQLEKQAFCFLMPSY